MHVGQLRNRAVELTSSQCSLLHATKSGSMHKVLGLTLYILARLDGARGYLQK